MQGRAKLLGHAVHPMLVVFPLGLLSVVPAFDAVGFFVRGGPWSQLAFWLCTIGVAGAIAAALFGFIDWLAIPRETRARRVGLTHMLVIAGASTLYLLSWIVRLTRGTTVATVPGFLLAVAGLAVMLVGGWLGGELVEQHGIGVRPEAHLDAPSSLDDERLLRRPPTSEAPPPA
jgi:uncharacterized membrane protein